MALTTLISATTAATESPSFEIAVVPTSIVAEGLKRDEFVQVKVLTVSGEYVPLVAGEKVRLTASQNVIIINAPGDYKVAKKITSGQVAVGYMN